MNPFRIRISLTKQILLGLAAGVVVGGLISHYNPELARIARPFSAIFLRMIKMIIAPLIFASLVSGIAGAGHLKTVGRMGFKALIYFEVVTTIALLVGLVVVNVLRPGVGVNLAAHAGEAEILAKPQTWDQILVHIVPTSIVQAMAEGDLLQIVVFSILFAVGASLAGPRAKILVEWCDAVTQTMFKFTNVVMHYAPIGVGAAMAYTVGHGGFRVLWNLMFLLITLYVALIVFCACVLVPVALLFRVPLRAFVRAVKEPAILAFTTTSSESALPLAMERLEELGIPRNIISFVLPLGYSFNLDGSTLYLTLATVFVAQAANVPLTLGQEITMCLTLMLTSKGIAGVPRASLVIISGMVATFGLPIEAVTLILGIDELMDMGRSLTNVVGNCLATAVIARWEGAWDGTTPPPGPDDEASLEPLEAGSPREASSL